MKLVKNYTYDIVIKSEQNEINEFVDTVHRLYGSDLLMRNLLFLWMGTRFKSAASAAFIFIMRLS